MLTHWYGNSTFFRLLTRLTRNLLGALSLPVRTANLQTCLGSLHVSYVLRDIFPSLVLYPDVNEILLLWLCFLCPIMFPDISSASLGKQEENSKILVYSSQLPLLFARLLEIDFFFFLRWRGGEGVRVGTFYLFPSFPIPVLWFPPLLIIPNWLYLILSDVKIGDVWRCPQI